MGLGVWGGGLFGGILSGLTKSTEHPMMAEVALCRGFGQLFYVLLASR